MAENTYAGKFPNSGTFTVGAKFKQPKDGTNKAHKGKDLRTGTGGGKK